MIKYLDLFAGCGGFSEGFEASGNYKGLAFVEWDKSAAATLRHRLREKWNYANADKIVIEEDIRELITIKSSKQGDHFDVDTRLSEAIGSDEIDLIIGGPPCQAYSMANKKKGNNEPDYRNYLFESYILMMKMYQPKVFVFENVQGIFSARPDGVSIMDCIESSFSDAGYEIVSDLKKNALLNVADFGVPQNRKRVFIVGVNRNKFKGDDLSQSLFDFYSKLSDYKVDDFSTVGSALKGLSEIRPIENWECGPSHEVVGKEGDISNHTPRFHSKRDQRIFFELAKDKENGGEKYSSIKALKELYEKEVKRSSNHHKYNVLDKDGPSNTIPAHLQKDGLRHIHFDPEQKRSITPREAARLQGFPDDFEFLMSRGIGVQYKMIGNAVPPKMSRIIADLLFDYLLEKV